MRALWAKVLAPCAFFGSGLGDDRQLGVRGRPMLARRFRCIRFLG